MCELLPILILLNIGETEKTDDFVIVLTITAFLISVHRPEF
jgi:hypothetical protein